MLWVGNGSSPRSIGGLEFKPDFVWLKDRSGTNWHRLQNSVVGANKLLYSNSSNDEATDESNGHVDAFTDDGFIVDDASGGAVNTNSYDYVAWCWKAGGASVSNSDGTITSQVSANQDAGFSIVTFTGTGSAGTVGHGLGKAPAVVITKRRNAAQAWFVHHVSLSNGHYLRLNDTNAQGGDTNVYPNNMSTTNTFAVGGDDGVNGNGSTYVSYCWAEIPGYSKFGVYQGNGQASNNSFVDCGFEPACVIFKRHNATDDWGIFDNKRVDSDPPNPLRRFLYPNANYAEWTGGTNDHMDFYSTGFKVQNVGSMIGASGGQYIYMAFASKPGDNVFDMVTDAN